MKAILNLFTCETWFYIIAISLQVSGAICLIINYWGNVKKKVILSYYEGSGLPKAQEDNTVKLERERLRSYAQVIYINRVAFINIVLGYGLGIFGEITENSCKLYILFTIVLICALITLLGCGLSVLFSKITYKEDIEVDRKSVEAITDVQWSEKEETEYVNSLFHKDI